MSSICHHYIFLRYLKFSNKSTNLHLQYLQVALFLNFSFKIVSWLKVNFSVTYKAITFYLPWIQISYSNFFYSLGPVEFDPEKISLASANGPPSDISDRSGGSAEKHQTSALTSTTTGTAASSTTAATTGRKMTTIVVDSCSRTWSRTTSRSARNSTHISSNSGGSSSSGNNKTRAASLLNLFIPSSSHSAASTNSRLTPPPPSLTSSSSNLCCPPSTSAAASTSEAFPESSGSFRLAEVQRRHLFFRLNTFFYFSNLYFFFPLFSFSFLANNFELQVPEGSKCRFVRRQLWKRLRLLLRRLRPGNRYRVLTIRPLKVEQNVGWIFSDIFWSNFNSAFVVVPFAPVFPRWAV